MFVTFEGPEGSGKSTQIRLLADFLRSRGRDVVVTREPGGTVIGDQVRACLHDVANTEMVSEAEILLYSASRAQLVREVIMPALSRKKIILCDRFYDSTLAYQGYGRGLDMKSLLQITEFATGGLKPDITLLFDLPVEVGLARRQANGEEMNRLDLEAVAFHRRVRAGYHELLAQDSARWVVVNAERSISDVQSDLQSFFSQRLL
jgi:dTMP kinase